MPKALSKININVALLAMILWVPLAAQTAQAKMPMVSMPDFSVLAEQNSPVVVNISTTRKMKKSSGHPSIQGVPEGMPEDMLRYFFGLPRGEHPRSLEPESKSEVSSLGSGFIISEDGYIVTNNHVIEDAEDIIVRMSNREEKKATLIGTDPRTDVALIKIDAEDLPVAHIGKSKRLKVGQWVLAIGEPFGLDYTVTHGIVSALGRALPDDTYVPFIQTDVPINPGNSGGPLFNMNGEVVGVNSQIYSKSGGSMGLSFSIPIDLVMNVVDQIKSKGAVTRGFLGVQVQQVSADLAKSFGLSKPTGALVAEVVKGQAAEKAGVQPGDVILEFAGQTIEKSSDLPPIVGMTPLNKKVNLLVLRNGKKTILTVKLGSLSGDKVASNDSGYNAKNLLNSEVGEVSSEALEKAGLDFGVRIVSVSKGPAKKAGLMPGDILVTINFKPIKSIKGLYKVLKEAPKDLSLPVRVVREKRSLFLPLVLN